MLEIVLKIVSVLIEPNWLPNWDLVSFISNWKLKENSILEEPKGDMVPEELDDKIIEKGIQEE
jgi:hypothetical protein